MCHVNSKIFHFCVQVTMMMCAIMPFMTLLGCLQLQAHMLSNCNTLSMTSNLRSIGKKLGRRCDEESKSGSKLKSNHLGT